MNSGTFKYIERMLYDYNKIEKHIEERIEEITYSTSAKDGNVNSNTNQPATKMAVTLADDLLIRNLRRTKDVIDEVLAELEPEAKLALKLYYIDKPRRYTWDGVAELTNQSKRNCYRIRDCAFIQIAERLGMPVD